MSYDHEFFANMVCPGPVTWVKDIQAMFTPLDIAHMKTKGLDLASYLDVKINAVPIYNQVANGYMPPAGSGENPWPPAWVTAFGCWIQQGCPQM